jgi:hypothetical protein
MATLGNTPRPGYVYDTETDTWVPIGVGAHTHAYIPNTLVDAKGDIVVASASDTPAILSKGSDGTVLVADSTTSTGLAWQPYGAQVVAGKNKLINGSFDIWQRGVTFSPGSITNSYGGDRWKCTYDDSTSGLTMSRVDIGDLNLGFKYAVSLKNTVGTKANANVRLQQAFETHDTHMMRGKTYTLSFYARKISGSSARISSMAGWTTTETNGFGSNDEITSIVPNSSLTTSFQRFSQTFVASSSSSYNSMKIQLDFQYLTSLNDELQITGVQLEEGVVPTPFSRAGGSLQGELAACQRYYWRSSNHGIYAYIAAGWVNSSTVAKIYYKLPQTMRIAPTSVEYQSLRLTDDSSYSVNVASIAMSANSVTSDSVGLAVTVASGLTTNQPTVLQTNNTSSGYLGLSAEI